MTASELVSAAIASVLEEWRDTGYLPDHVCGDVCPCADVPCLRPPHDTGLHSPTGHDPEENTDA